MHLGLGHNGVPDWQNAEWLVIQKLVSPIAGGWKGG